ncbi:hypothetical protein I4F81_002605 [Pyropia yezoensis]|uniref:Uncharacterized protein n=1 Tax=Pyropia yezoensis TaxID=2788 RepID=A0ACC3BQZ6_PYRYE|nr:hypothetical protein I4F81_002605 [Neopyropia yezoensis]
MEYVPSLRLFILVVEVPPGEYHYRFVVDGRWRLAEDATDIGVDAFGEQSHVLRLDGAAAPPGVDVLAATTAAAAASFDDLPSDDEAMPDDYFRHPPAPPLTLNSDAGDGGGGGAREAARVRARLAERSAAGAPGAPPPAVHFPTEPGFRPMAGAGVPVRSADAVIDPAARSQFLAQVEENAAQRQAVGAALLARGEADAALALFSLAVRLREKNGLKYAERNAGAHGEVARAFAALGDAANEEKHLRAAVRVWTVGHLRGAGARLGDLRLRLGVVLDRGGAWLDADAEYAAALQCYARGRYTGANVGVARENRAAVAAKVAAAGGVAAVAAAGRENVPPPRVADGRAALLRGDYDGALDAYTLAIYARKRHGPWASVANAECHVDTARALFASGRLPETLRRHPEAEGEHVRGLHDLAAAGVPEGGAAWRKAWRKLEANLAAQGRGGEGAAAAAVWGGRGRKVESVVLKR